MMLRILKFAQVRLSGIAGKIQSGVAGDNFFLARETNDDPNSGRPRPIPSAMEVSRCGNGIPSHSMASARYTAEIKSMCR